MTNGYDVNYENKAGYSWRDGNLIFHESFSKDIWSLIPLWCNGFLAKLIERYFDFIDSLESKFSDTLGKTVIVKNQKYKEINM